MSTEQKSQLIGTIIAHLRFAAKSQDKAFNEGDTFFSLCFKTDADLNNIAKLCGA
jgi:hypothetical protein